MPLKNILTAVVLGLLLGIGSVYLALENDWHFDTLQQGPWGGAPRAGGLNADPYSRARLVQTAALPLGGGEGIAFSATTDSEGAALNARCTYTVRGAMLPARWWTFTVADGAGALLDNPLQRYGFTSAEITRDLDGRFALHISKHVHTGHWLPVPPEGALQFVLRLYDSTLAQSDRLDRHELPQITREACS